MEEELRSIEKNLT